MTTYAQVKGGKIDRFVTAKSKPAARGGYEFLDEQECEARGVCGWPKPVVKPEPAPVKKKAPTKKKAPAKKKTPAKKK